RRRHTRLVSDWSSDVCSSDLGGSEWVRSGAVTNHTTANNGGIEYVFAGGVANNLTLNNGASATMLGNVNGATINVGAEVDVFDEIGRASCRERRRDDASAGSR